MPDRDDLIEAGRAVGRAIQARIAANRSVAQSPKRGNRRTSGLWRKDSAFAPADAEQFIRGGGMGRIEWIAGQRAHDAAIRAERELWLPRLERWLRHASGPRAALLTMEIKRLRRCLGIKPSPEHVREQTRQRVRNFRRRRNNGSIDR
jgi:hypothetical protein